MHVALLLLRSLALGMQKLDQRRDLVWLKDVPEGRHAAATVVDLMRNLLLRPAFTDSAEVRAKLPATTIDTMAVFTASFVKQHGSQLDGLR